MPSLQLFPGKGTGSFIAGLPLRIRLSRKGCANRPFYHLVLQEVSINQMFKKFITF